MNITVTVGSPAHGGHCIARHDGRAVFVRHALPGEVVEAVVTEGGDDARFWRADAVRVIEPSVDRVEHPWPLAGPGGVGGAELGHVSVEAQRAWKLAVLTEAFERFAGMEFPGSVQGVPGDDQRAGLGYRTRITAVAGADGRPAMKKHRSDEALTIDSMPLAVWEAEDALIHARHEPGLRITATASSTGETVLTYEGDRAAVVRELVPTAVGDIEYDVRADGFWQVHAVAPELLVDEVAYRVGNARSVLDLYSGAGLFGIALAAAGMDVSMIEFDRRATNDALRTLKRLGLRAHVTASDVRRALASGNVKPADVAVIDPPRSGAGAATLRALSDVAPERIIYVACDPVALARDTAILAELGWSLTEAQAFDLFPMTHHVETIATFDRD